VKDDLLDGRVSVRRISLTDKENDKLDRRFTQRLKPSRDSIKSQTRGPLETKAFLLLWFYVHSCAYRKNKPSTQTADKFMQTFSLESD